MQWFLLFLLLFSVAPKSHATSYEVGGLRPAILNTPPDYSPEKKFPLLLFLHGYTGTSAYYERYLDVTTQLSQRGFVSIVPNGSKNSKGYQFWNATPECCDFEASGIDDVGYLTQLIQEASARFSIDPKRIYLMGHSNGGFMSYRMACESNGLIAGIISIAGATFKTPEQCLRPFPLKVLQIHGDKDDVVPYGENESFPSPSFSVQAWKQQMQCQSTIELKSALDLTQDILPDTDTRETDTLLWDNCLDGAKVGLWTIRGGSHSPSFYPASLFSKVLEFMEAQSLPDSFD